MFVIVVRCQVEPERVDAFIEASLDDARHSVQDEPGCRRFDLVQDQEDRTKIWLYEVYEDQAAFDHHLTTPHYARWKSTVTGWFTTPELSKARSIFMTEDAANA